MKNRIDIENIPSLLHNNSSIIEDFYYEKVNENIDTLVNELSNTVWNNYVITWFRGAGKTTFAKFLEDKVTSSGNLFVFIDYPISKGYYTLLKKIIRQLYISLENSSNIDKKIKQEILEEMWELYISTFNKVTTNRSFSKTKKEIKKISKNYNIWRALLLIGSIFSFCSYFLFEQVNHPFLLWLWVSALFITSFLKEILKIVTYIYTSEEEDIDDYKNEFNVQSYYDDDISEEHLKNTIEKIEHRGISITFIVDELDKIDDDVQINTIINSIKPLLLSWICNFIIISWQQTLYKIYNWRIQSDLVINSLFTREIHIPLFSKNYFERIILWIIKSDKEYNPKQINIDHLTSYLIIKSNKNIRRFIINLRKMIHKKDDLWYINIEDDDIYSEENNIQSLVEEIENEQLQHLYPWVRDYIINDIYIWINKIFLRGRHYFSIEDIIMSDKTPEYINFYSNEISEIAEFFFSQLTYQKILSKKGEKYKLKLQVKTKINNEIRSKEDLFLQNLSLLKKLSKDTYNYYSPNWEEEIKHIITFLSEKFKLGLNVERALKLEDSLLKWGNIAKSKGAQITILNSAIPTLLRKIIEWYNADLLADFFTKNWFSNNSNNLISGKTYDYTFTKKEKVINIEIRFNSFEISSQLENINEEEYYIYIFYYDYKIYWYNNIQNLNKILNNKKLNKNVFLINNSEERWLVNPSTTKAYLEKIINEIDKNDNVKTFIPFETTRNIVSGYQSLDNKVVLSNQEIITIASYPLEISNSILINIFIKNILLWKTWLYVYGNIIQSKFIDGVTNRLNIDLNNLNSWDIDESKFQELWITMEELSKNSIWNIHDIAEVEEKVNTLSNDISFIFLENIQNYADSSKEYNNLYKKLKDLAKLNNLTIIVTSSIPYEKLSGSYDKRGTIEMLNKYSPQILNLSNSIVLAYKEDYWDEFTERKWIIDIQIWKWSIKKWYWYSHMELYENRNGAIFEHEDKKVESTENDLQ